MHLYKFYVWLHSLIARLWLRLALSDGPNTPDMETNTVSENIQDDGSVLTSKNFQISAIALHSICWYIRIIMAGSATKYQISSVCL
jgi:hypothetical protein